jgi:RimJ/RimL family protein N-acetyltransferase
MTAQLIKAHRITGRHLVLRDAQVRDAGFILGLRTDAAKAQHLSATSPALTAQRDWLQRYVTGQDPDQAYFIIEDRAGLALGTVRLYDPHGSSFCWGSWIIVDGAPAGHAIESALMVYHYALGLGFTAAHFDVRQANQSVWRFHERFGAVRVGETELDYLYTIDEAAIRAALDRYARYLPEGIRVERD